jgi:ketosteroid isomerase-like protein
MHPNEQLIHNFYSAFQRHDGVGMAACYHPEVVFSDPVFVDLHGSRAKSMWQMLCERGKDLTLTFSNVRADDQSGSAHWEATYTFSTTGRKVLNIIDATFEFRDGKIIKHTDTFDFWRWSRQALGMSGVLLGWSPFLQNTVRKTAIKGLDAFVAKRGDQNG